MEEVILCPVCEGTGLVGVGDEREHCPLCAGTGRWTVDYEAEARAFDEDTTP